MSIGIYFGIDTSNYTTSAAAVTTAGEVFLAKRPLDVPQGSRGLRQSDALFCHTRDLPQVVEECLEKVKKEKGEYSLLAVGASNQPRRIEGSYMPCFLAGVNAGQVAARLADVPFYTFSHQEGHVEAARCGAKLLGKGDLPSEFLAFHLSGGTTELVLVQEEEGRYHCQVVADTLDLTCGQLIDRSGVALGLPFPAGPHLEKLAQASQKRWKVTIPKKETGINLSGFENRFEQMVSQGEKKEDAAAFIFQVTVAACRTLLEISGREDLPVLFSGGVSSSQLLRAAFSGEQYFFAPAEYSADNAIGTAYLTRKRAAL